MVCLFVCVGTSLVESGLFVCVGMSLVESGLFVCLCGHVFGRVVCLFVCLFVWACL